MVYRHLGNICAIIVKYNIGFQYRENFDSIIPQVHRVFIIDNGSDPETVSLLKTLKEENPEEDFFIDYVDSEFCMTLITHGWKILLVKNAVLEHTLGNKQSHNFLGLEFVASHHFPERRFTIYRNRVCLLKKYLFRVPSFVIYDIAAAGYDLLRILLFDKNRARKLIQIVKGGLTGLLNSYDCMERF